MSSEAYPHLKLINDSIHLLYKSLKPARIHAFTNHGLYEDIQAISWSDPIIATQQAARLIALHYQLPVTTAVVYFPANLPVPGRIELSRTNDYFIEIDASLRPNKNWVMAILAHEIAHIFLHQHGVRYEAELPNEVLTDTTATYLGCGTLILNGATEIKERLDQNTTRRIRQHFGYLTLAEFGYILAKRDLFFGLYSGRQLKSL